MPLFGVDEVLPHRGEADLAGAELRARVNEAVDALSALVNEDVQKLLMRVLKLVNLPRLSATDDHDLRAVLAELRICAQEDGRGYKKRLRRETHVERPRGIGQLLRPRWVKAAAAEGTCGLCARTTASAT